MAIERKKVTRFLLDENKETMNFDYLFIGIFHSLIKCHDRSTRMAGNIVGRYYKSMIIIVVFLQL